MLDSPSSREPHTEEQSIFGEWLTLSRTAIPLQGSALRFVVEELNRGASNALVEGVHAQTRPAVSLAVTTGEQEVSWPLAARVGACVELRTSGTVEFYSLRISLSEQAGWIRRYRIEFRDENGRWAVAVPSRLVDSNHRSPVNLPLELRSVESSRIPEGATTWIDSFYHDFLLRAVEKVGPDSEYPDWLTGQFMLTAATTPFAFAGGYNPGDCANFNAMVAAILCPRVATETEKVFQDMIGRYGFLPSVLDKRKDESAVGLDNTGLNWPPLCYRDVFAWTRDDHFLSEFSASCETWARWILDHRDPDRDGWIELGMNGCTPAPQEYKAEMARRNPDIALRAPDYWDYVGLHMTRQSAFQSAIYELGTDDAPVYVSGRHKGVRFDPESCTLSVHYLDAQLFMAFLAGFISFAADRAGDKETARAFAEKADHFEALVAEHCWDTHSGFYYDRERETGRLRTDMKHVAGFLPMVLGIPRPQQAERMVRHLMSPHEFWTDYPVPSISRDTPDFMPSGYWSGRAWPPYNYIILRGLLNYGYFELADRLIETWIDHTRSCRHRPDAGSSSRRTESRSTYDARRVDYPDIEWVVAENWNCETGAVHGSGSLTWGALWIPAVVMRNFWPVDENRAIVRPGGVLRLDLPGRWDVAVDGMRATVNGIGLTMEPDTSYLVNTHDGSCEPLLPGQADPTAMRPHKGGEK